MARALNTKLVETAKPDPARRIEIADGAVSRALSRRPAKRREIVGGALSKRRQAGEANARPLPSPAAWRGARGCAGGTAASSRRDRTPARTR